MTISRQQKTRVLAAEELDAVSGGLTAAFEYAGNRWEISAWAGGYMVETTVGGKLTEVVIWEKGSGVPL